MMALGRSGLQNWRYFVCTGGFYDAVSSVTYTPFCSVLDLA